MCMICKHTSCLAACPNFIPPKAYHYCSICTEGIYDGERYIEYDFGEYIHEDCIKNTTQLLKWLGYTVETMEDTNERDH